jgi:hypothetical protein
LTTAQVVLGLCERFGCLPSALMAEDVSLLRMVAVEHLGRDKDQGGG